MLQLKSAKKIDQGSGSTSNELSFEAKSWYLIQTKNKEELHVGALLRARQTPTILPMIKCRQYKFGKETIGLEPLFPDYIFANFNYERDSEKIKWLPGIKQIVCFNNRPALVQDEVIHFLKLHMSRSIGFAASRRFCANQTVRIKRGPLKDLEGFFVQELEGKERVRILLNALSFSHKVELHPSWIEAV